jgi:hypothetical protein
MLLRHALPLAHAYRMRFGSRGNYTYTVRSRAICCDECISALRCSDFMSSKLDGLDGAAATPTRAISPKPFGRPTLRLSDKGVRRRPTAGQHALPRLK